ncbi:MAG: DUF4292 domain-containing protein [Crocinitomicaceae bacterium]|nr:DUF4292 domain-containing protein [Flavobacteriales bacterium]NQZ35646.1 DUF4292 domain-containing protein [Crocinitomicaceae bacterium]
MRLNFNLLIAAIAVLLLASCGNRRRGEDKLPKVKEAVMIEKLDSLSSQTFTSFYSKLSTKYTDSSRNLSFKTSLRMVQDSAIGVLVKYASIPVINAVISKDSVKMTNKKDKCYVLQSIDFLKESFGVSFSHRNMEELLMGFPIAYSKDSEYDRVKDPYAYILSSQFKKEGDTGDELTIYYEFNTAVNQLKSTRIESVSDSTEIKIDYLTRQFVDGYSVPETVSIVIRTPKQEISIELEYRKARVNKRETIHFVIPDSYEPCK